LNWEQTEKLVTMVLEEKNPLKLSKELVCPKRDLEIMKRRCRQKNLKCGRRKLLQQNQNQTTKIDHFDEDGKYYIKK
jgi:hypothetical protein